MTAPKNTAAKKIPAKKAPAKKAPARKAPAKKTAAMKTPAKKAPAEKTAAETTAAETTTAATTTAKKAPAGKTASKKAPAKKASSAAAFTDAERAAMKERAAEMKAARQGGDRASEDADAVLAKIAEMQQPDRALAERIHGIITSVAPELSPKTWYGMPAYAKSGKIICFFQPAQKFRARYSMLGFNDPAKLDDGTMWPTAYAVTEVTDADAKRIEDLIKRAVS